MPERSSALNSRQPEIVSISCVILLKVISLPTPRNLCSISKNVRKGIESGDIVAARSVGFGGVAEGIAKMSFGNGIGADVRVSDKDLFDFGHGSLIVESKTRLTSPNAELIGETVEGALRVNGVEIAIGEAFEANRGRFNKVYPDRSGVEGKVENASSGACTSRWEGEKTEHPVVFLPLFPRHKLRLRHDQGIRA